MTAEQAARTADEAGYLGRPAQTGSGRPVTVMVNVDDTTLPDGVDPAHCDGIGLARTEFLFMGERALPDEDAQHRVYARLVQRAAGDVETARVGTGVSGR